MESNPSKGITDAEITAIEQEVAKKQAEALKTASESQAKDIEDKVRKEMELRLEAERLKDQVKKQEEEMTKKLAETDAKLKSQQEAFEKRLAELEAQKRGTVTNQSPFAQSGSSTVKNVNGVELDTSKLNHTEIERQSAEAFRKHFNLPHFYFEKTGEVKR